MEIFAASYLLPITAPPISGGAVAVDNGRILATGRLADVRSRFGGVVHDYPGCIIMPGLVNAHTHLELTHFPSWKIRKGIDYSPRTYVDWIIQVIKIRRSLSKAELELSVREGIRISLESGTTAIGEILSDRSLLPLYEHSALTGRIFFEALGQDPVRCQNLATEIAAMAETFPRGNMLPGLSPHAPHTVSGELARFLAQIGGEKEIPLSIHLSESPEEGTFMFDSTGRIADQLYPFVDWSQYLPPPRHTSSTAYIDSLGLLGTSTTAVHCVRVTPNDVQILKDRGVKVVLCPRSNDKLAVGQAPAAMLKKAGIPLALGTDSLASNDSLSMLDEARFLSNSFPAVFSADEVVAMATFGGALALGMAGDIGSIEVGKRADLVVMEIAGSIADPAAAIIRDGTLKEVIVGGGIL